MDKNRKVYIIDGRRTPFLKSTGVPGPFSASDLAVRAAQPLLTQYPFLTEQSDEIILGSVAPSVDEMNIARLVALRLGFKQSIPAWTVSRNCASSMQAVDAAANNIISGRSNLIVAGGTESMSHAPLLFNQQFSAWLGNFYKQKSIPEKLKALIKFRPSLLKPIISLIRGLNDPTCNMSMGQTAEEISFIFEISRQEMDEYATQSHQRLYKAQSEQQLTQEITPIFDHNGKSYTHDNGVRPDVSIDSLKKLKPVFDKPTGLITAGNSAQITDGSAILILASGEALSEHSLTPKAEVIDTAWAGVNPEQMGLGPVHAVVQLLNKHEINHNDIDYWELNEAFAGQVLACIKAFQSEDYLKKHFPKAPPPFSIPLDRININGGGVSLGHPVGASGARIILHASNVLSQNNWRFAIATLCIGGGQGGAMLIRNAQI